MKDVPFGNFAVFIIFFAIALIEALQNHHWVEALLFLALGFFSLWVDLRKK